MRHEVSSCNANASFTYTIAGIISSQVYTLTDDSWLQYVRDHREFLKHRATKVPITEEMMVRYRYRLADYLDEKHKLRDLTQITNIINSFSSDMDFNDNLPFLYVPDKEIIKNMREQYATIQGRIKKELA